MACLPNTGANREIFLKFSQAKSGRKNDLSFFSILSVFSTHFTQFSSSSAIVCLDEHLLYVSNILLSSQSLSPHYPFLLPRNSLCLGKELQSVHNMLLTVPSYSHSSPGPVCGLSHRRQSSMNCKPCGSPFTTSVYMLSPDTVLQEEQFPLMEPQALAENLF